MAKCKKCGADIIWLKTPRGKWMCADEGLKPYRQNKAGKDTVVTDWGETIRCDLLSPEDCKAGRAIPTGLARTPHWATCPEADSFRKQKTEEKK